MNVPSLVSRLAGMTGLPRFRTRLLLRDFVLVLQEELARGGSVTLHGLGTFRVKSCGARVIYLHTMPRTTPGRKISFRPSRSLKAALL